MTASSPADVRAVPAAADLLAELTAELGSAQEARWVLAAALGVPGREVAVRLAAGVDPSVADAARTMAARRRTGEPLQYVLGTWAFRSLELAVDRRVLVPRPETEQVVAAALDELARADDEVTPLAAADLGTGSGAIALSLAAEGPPRLEVWATDVAPGALEVATHNLALLAAADPTAASRVHLVAGSWFDALPERLMGTLQLVASNPPYVSAAEWEGLDPVVRDHEPHGALVAGPTGLEDLLHIVDTAPAWLAPGGSLVAELAPHQADTVAAAASTRGYESVEVRADLAGRARTLVVRTARRIR